MRPEYAANPLPHLIFQPPGRERLLAPDHLTDRSNDPSLGHPPKRADPEGCRMAWIYLLIAGLLEIGWAIGLKYTEGFSRLWPSVLTIAAMIFSLTFLGLALKTLPVGTAYAVWTGIGAIGTVTFGIWLFGEPATAARLACIGLILAGIVGLKLVT